MLALIIGGPWRGIIAKTVRAILGDIYDAWRAQNLDWLATYLPDDFCHVIHIQSTCTPRCGKKEALERLRLIVEQFDFVVFDTSDLLIEKNRAAVEVPIHYRHRESGAPFESTKANFWTLEDGWPVKLTEYHDIARVQAFVAAHAGAHPA